MRRILPWLPLLLWLLPVYLTEGASVLFSLLCCVLFHEGGHLFALLLLRVRRVRGRGVACGILLTPNIPLSYPRELILLLAGPLFSFGGFFLCRLLSAHCDTSVLPLLSTLHLTLGLYNLLPLFVTDGAKALRILALLAFGAAYGESIARALMWGTALLCFFSLLFTMLCHDTGYRLFFSLCLLLVTATKTEDYGEFKRKTEKK